MGYYATVPKLEYPFPTRDIAACLPGRCARCECDLRDPGRVVYYESESQWNSGAMVEVAVCKECNIILWKVDDAAPLLAAKIEKVIDAHRRYTQRLTTKERWDKRRKKRARAAKRAMQKAYQTSDLGYWSDTPVFATWAD